MAIGDYPEESGWEKIHAANDCDLIIPMLKTNGFKEVDIKILTEEKATKAQIVKAFQILTSQTRPNDSALYRAFTRVKTIFATTNWSA